MMMLKSLGRKTTAWLTVMLLVLGCLLTTAYAEGSEVSLPSEADSQAADSTENELFNDGQMNLDVVFVLDASGSMTKSDPNKVALDAYRLFVDLLDDTCGIGYVVFTHELLEAGDIVDISDKEALEATKKKMAAVKYDYAGYTDIALGLTKAKDMLTDPAVKEDHRKKVIILLTDGNTALPEEGARSLEKSNNEMDATLMALYDYQIPVYAIGLNYNGRMKKEELDRIATETNGSRFETTTSEELVEIFSNIFGRIYQLSGEQKEIVDGNVTITVADNSVFTVSIIIRSAFTLQELNPVLTNAAGQNVPLTNNSDVVVSSTGSYVMIKIFYPDEGKWNLHLDKVNNDNCVVTQMDYYSVFLEQTVATPYPVGKTMTIETKIKNKDGVLQDKRLLTSITMNARIVDENGKQTTKLMRSDVTGVYHCEWTPEAVGKYTITTIAETPKFKKTGKTEKVEIMTEEAYEAYLKEADLEESEGYKDSGNAWFTVTVIVIILVVVGALTFAITVLVRNARKPKALSGEADQPIEVAPNPAAQQQLKPAKAEDMKPATPPKLVDYEIVEHDALETLIKKGPEDAFNTSADDYQSDAALEALIRKGPDNVFAVGKDKLPEEMDDDEYEDDDEYGTEDEGSLDEEYADDDDDDDGDDSNNPLAGLNIRKN